MKRCISLIANLQFFTTLKMIHLSPESLEKYQPNLVQQIHLLGLGNQAYLNQGFLYTNMVDG